MTPNEIDAEPSGNTTSTDIVLDISSLLPKKQRPLPRLKRLTAPGNDETNADLVTWAGQAWTNGTAFGREKFELVSNGKVKLRGSEAVLVFLDT